MGGIEEKQTEKKTSGYTEPDWRDRAASPRQGGRGRKGGETLIENGPDGGGDLTFPDASRSHDFRIMGPRWIHSGKDEKEKIVRRQIPEDLVVERRRQRRKIDEMPIARHPRKTHCAQEQTREVRQKILTRTTAESMRETSGPSP